MGSNKGTLKSIGVKDIRWKCRGDPYLLTLLGVELLGQWLGIHFPLKGRQFDNQFWVFGFVPSVLTAFRTTILRLPKTQIA